MKITKNQKDRIILICHGMFILLFMIMFLGAIKFWINDGGIIRDKSLSGNMFWIMVIMIIAEHFTKFISIMSTIIIKQTKKVYKNRKKKK